MIIIISCFLCDAFSISVEEAYDLCAHAVTCPALCCFTVAAGRTRWIGSCPLLGPLAGRAPPRWVKQSLLCSARARAPSTRLAGRPGMTSTERSQKRRLSSVWWCFPSCLSSSVSSSVSELQNLSLCYRCVLLDPRNTSLPSHMHAARQH